LNLEKGRGNFDHQQVLSVSWLWSPDYKLSNVLARNLLGGWSIGAFHTVQTGAPLNIVMGTDVALNGTGQQNLQHAQLAPNVTNDDIPLDHPDRNAFVTRFFNTAAFVPASQLPRGLYGNVGRNVLTGPALSSTDFTLMKDIRVRETLKVQLRGEFFNAFNHPNFDAPNAQVSSGSFGRILSAQPGRVVQVALKFIW
jgi:hypothetical protein